jgi:hypothetical protein
MVMETIRVHLPAKRTSTRTSIIGGLLTGGTLIVYFLVMRLLNLHYIFELRYFNAVILFLGVLFLLQKLRNDKGKIAYLAGLGAGFTMVFVSALVFSIFIFAYLMFIDPAFLQFIKTHTPTGEDLDVWILVGLIFSEALSSGAVFTFMLMQYYKDDTTEVD